MWDHIVYDFYIFHVAIYCDNLLIIKLVSVGRLTKS